MGIAKYEMKLMIDDQFPMVLVHSATLRRPYLAICCSLILISSRFVRNENSGAKGKAVAKNAIKPS